MLNRDRAGVMSVVLSCAALCAVLLAGGFAAAAETKAVDEKAADEKAAKTCPISGKPAREDCNVEVNGQKVAFCCGKCHTAYTKKLGVDLAKTPACAISGQPGDPELSIIRRTAKLVSFCCNKCCKSFCEENKVAFKDAPSKACPISGKPGNPDHTLRVAGDKVSFCCGKCRKAYAKKLGVNLEKTPACAISGKPGKPELSLVVLKGELVGFCCNKCKKKYVAANFRDGRIVSPKKDAPSKKGTPKKKDGDDEAKKSTKTKAKLRI